MGPGRLAACHRGCQRVQGGEADDLGLGPLAAFAGTPGDIRRVATMGETLPQGGSVGRFAPNGVAVAGPGGALTFATVAQKEGERNAIYCRCPVSPR